MANDNWRVDVRQLQTFRTILEEGNFRRAARAQGYSQSAVTLHVQRLERELGVALFHRQGRRTTLSPAGAALAARCRPILDGLEDLKRTMAELAGGTGGALRLASIEPTASRRLAPRLAHFCRRRPGLRVRLEVAGTSGVARAVTQGDVDFGVCSAPPHELGLRFEPLFDEPMELLLPRRHPLAGSRRVPAGKLAGHRLLLTEQGCAYRRAVEQALEAAGAAVDCAVEIGSLMGLVRAVQSGLGVAIVPACAADPAPAGTVRRRLEGADVTLRVGLVRRDAGFDPTPAAAAFMGDLRLQAGRWGARLGRPAA